MFKLDFKGVTREAELKWQAIRKSLPENPVVCWYPSAGNDYRDLVELHSSKLNQYGITKAPDLFIHTDYYPGLVDFVNPEPWAEEISVTIHSKVQIQFKENIRYMIIPQHVSFPEAANTVPVIYLLDVSVKGDEIGEIRKPVLYFMFENINFLHEILLRMRIEVQFIVKIREGMGFGANAKCISVAYAFLDQLKTKYLFVDWEVQTDLKLVEAIKSIENLKPRDYELIALSEPFKWSDFNTICYQVNLLNETMTRESFIDKLKYISQDRYGDSFEID